LTFLLRFWLGPSYSREQHGNAAVKRTPCRPPGRIHDNT
jgi:hypothetical protein